MIKGIIFDVGGVLENNTDPIIYRLLSEKFNRNVGLIEKEIEEILPDLQTGKMTAEDFWVRISEKLKINIPTENLLSFWKSIYVENVKMQDEVTNLVEKSRMAGFKLAVLSNTEPQHTAYNKEIDKFGGFDIVILSCDVGLRKPDSEIYKLTLKRLGLRADECIFIDDKEEYLTPAKKLGIKTILYQDYSELKEALSRFDVVM